MDDAQKLRICQRRLEMSDMFWMRAAKEALAGDMRALRNRVEMKEAPPVTIVLSEASQ